MNIHRSPEKDAEHQDVNLLLPWYVNASLSEADQVRVDAHLKQCETCRQDLSVEQRVYRGIADEAAVEYMPAASLKRLQSRLDGGEVQTTPTESASSKPHAGRWSWRGAMAASLIGVALAVTVTVSSRIARQSSHQLSPDFYTVTTAVPRPPDEVIRAVFAPNVTVSDLQSLLDEAQLRIVAGPSEAGVYSLAATSTTAVNVSLARLRQHSTVRFAETTKLSTDSGRPP